MQDSRPNPDDLLRRVVDEEKRRSRGKHTIFFGAAPGVGKTYTMLEVARSELEREKRDVVIGVVETHGRYETGALVLGMELLPRRTSSYRGIELSEFDLDAALARRPELILMDELAHTNAEGGRHPKRWQDVDELLDAGIDVFSTMNVQHLESLNDVIAKITGVHVRETVPDSVLEAAHDIKLVDLPPDDLLERLREGKVYVPAQAQRAIENFFRKGNLIALRELALRHTAERVDAQMRAYRSAQGIEQTWAATEQLVVAVSPSPYSARLIRAARRMASALHARWFAVYVEPERVARLPKAAQQRLSENLRLATQLGAEVVTLLGNDASVEILRFARERNITKIIVGKPVAHGALQWLRGSLVDRLVRESGDIDVYVTAGDVEAEPTTRDAPTLPKPRASGMAAAVVTVVLATGVSWALFGRQQLADVVMIYLLGIVLVSVRTGLTTSLFAALLSVAAFDFIFIPPYFTFAIADFRHAVTFVVMFLVAVLLSGLTQRVRHQAARAREREQRTLALYALTRELAGAQDSAAVTEITARHLEQAFQCRVSVFTPGASGKLERNYASKGSEGELDRDASISQWVFYNKQEAGLGTRTLPSSSTLYVPLMASGSLVGVLGLTPEAPDRFDSVEQRRQVDALAVQMALALERARLADETERARREVEAEQLRSALLSSVSHDLRTPLAVIRGAADALLDARTPYEGTTRIELTRTILDEALRLTRLIKNLLDMTRLQAGAMSVKKEWVPLEELIGGALERLSAAIGKREIQVQLPPELLLVHCDASLLEQALINLLENALKYSEGAIEVSASQQEGEVLAAIADRGPGIPVGAETQVFEKFHRAGREGSPGGVGLGLAICRGIIAAHGGRIWVQNREGGGAVFKFTLPNDARAPEVEPEGTSAIAAEPQTPQ
ncbi:MAG TPA: sensor histidine kinase KdpD [Polyangiaceae bacterium]|nr:sensor histidine kinase KdpD [Polyangiaceae bacterium]